MDLRARAIERCSGGTRTTRLPRPRRTLCALCALPALVVPVATVSVGAVGAVVLGTAPAGAGGIAGADPAELPDGTGDVILCDSTTRVPAGEARLDLSGARLAVEEAPGNDGTWSVVVDLSTVPPLSTELAALRGVDALAVVKLAGEDGAAIEVRVREGAAGPVTQILGADSGIVRGASAEVVTLSDGNVSVAVTGLGFEPTVWGAFTRFVNGEHFACDKLDGTLSDTGVPTRPVERAAPATTSTTREPSPTATTPDPHLGSSTTPPAGTAPPPPSAVPVGSTASAWGWWRWVAAAVAAVAAAIAALLVLVAKAKRGPPSPTGPEPGWERRGEPGWNRRHGGPDPAADPGAGRRRRRAGDPEPLPLRDVPPIGEPEPVLPEGPCAPLERAYAERYAEMEAAQTRRDAAARRRDRADAALTEAQAAEDAAVADAGGEGRSARSAELAARQAAEGLDEDQIDDERLAGNAAALERERATRAQLDAAREEYRSARDALAEAERALAEAEEAARRAWQEAEDCRARLGGRAPEPEPQPEPPLTDGDYGA